MYEIWLQPNDGSDPECIYKTTNFEEVDECHDGLLQWRSDDKKVLSDWEVEFAVIAGGKPVALPARRKAIFPDPEWDKYWAHLQTEELTFFDVFCQNVDGTGQVCNRHFELAKAVREVIDHLEAGGGYVIRMRTGTSVPLPAPKRKEMASEG